MKLLILLQCCVLLCKLAAGYEGEGYREGLGMENGKIADNQITASSERLNYKAVQARLRYKNRGRPFGWQPKDSSCTEWLQVDLLDNYIVTGVATQGCLPVNPNSKLVFTVTKYQLEYSNDGKVFSTNHKLYKGNKDGSTVVYHTLETPIKARYIRFQPKSWNKKICMRVELYSNNAKGSGSGLEDSVIVGNNRNYLRTLRSWLSPVARSVNSAWKRCWHASVDGWAARTFHSRCDGKGPTVTIIRVGKYIFGGYTSLSWDSSSWYQYDSKAFLFSLVNKPGWAPVKLPQTGKYSSRRAHSIACYSPYGPTFGGGHDIRISNYASSNSDSYSKLGFTYSPPSGYSFGSTFAKTFLAGTYHFTPDEVETFYETN